MAIDNDLLIILPFLGQFIQDAATSDPLLGNVTFFETDKVTLKNVYEQTGNPLDPFQVAVNPIQLNAAGGFVNAGGNIFVPYVYPFDELDNTTPQLYYVEVRRTDTTLAWAIDNFPLNHDGGSISVEGQQTNLCPSYGFEFPTFDNFYSESEQHPVRNWAPNLPNNARFARGWQWTNNGFEDNDFFIEFVPIATGTISPTNPTYKIDLTQTTVIAPGTLNWLGFELVKGNGLEGQSITYQPYIQDVSGTLGTLTLALVPHNNVSSLTVVGTIPITSSLAEQTITFTMADMSGLITQANEIIYLAFVLPNTFPISQALSFTGTFSSVGTTVVPLDEIEILEAGNNTASAFWSNLGSGLWEIGNQATSTGLPLSVAKGNLGAFNDVGNIWTGAVASSNTYEAAASSLPLTGQTLVINQPLLSSSTNRFLTSGLAFLGGNSFLVTPVTAVSFDVETNVQQASFSPWVSSTGAITIVAGAGSGISELTVLNRAANVLDVEFSTAYVADILEALYLKSAQGFIFDQGTGFKTLNINNMVGSFSLAASGVDFTTSSDVTVVNVAGSPAKATITFAPGGVAEATIKSTTQILTESFTGTTNTFYLNYFCFLASATSSPKMPIPPPIIIQFHVNGSGIQVPATLHTYTLNLATSDLSSGTDMAIALESLIDVSDEYTITTNSLPANGANLQVSTGNANFIIIFHDTAFAQPANPVPARPPIYVTFTSATTLADLTTAIEAAFQQEVGSIPTESDLELAALAESNIIQYYVRV